LGIDYLIARSCPVKEELGDYFLVLAKKRAGLNFLEQVQAEHPGFTEETIFEEMEETPQGINSRKTSLAVMREEVTPLLEWDEECAECGANFTYHPGGCWGHIPYPVPKIIEKLLLTTAQTLIVENKDHRAGEMLRPLPEANAKTELVQGWRQNGLPELNAPLTYTWGYYFRRRSINSDQLLEIIFGHNLLEAEKLSQVTYFLEYLQRHSKAGMEKAMADNGKVAEQAQQFQELLLPYWQFIKACQIADELEESVLLIP
jgi:hypothetical protein